VLSEKAQPSVLEALKLAGLL
jgi:hypothetical protein